jgi:DNA-binding MarR family transcriptional regulator
MTTTRPTVNDEPIGTGLGYLVRRAHRAFSRAMKVSLAEHGVSLGQYQVLRVLFTHDGITQSELSDQLEVKKGALTVMFEGLERDGYITRRRPPSDGRKLNVFLTTKSRRLQRTLVRIARDINASAQEGVAQRDIDLTSRVIEAVIGNLEQMFEE